MECRNYLKLCKKKSLKKDEIYFKKMNFVYAAFMKCEYEKLLPVWKLIVKYQRYNKKFIKSKKAHIYILTSIFSRLFCNFK